MLREIVLDTETTGTDPAGDRIVEIGCVELLNYIPTGRTFHVYVNPQRPCPRGATGSWTVRQLPRRQAGFRRGRAELHGVRARGAARHP